MRVQNLFLFLIMTVIFTVTGCELVNSNQNEAEVIRNGDQIYIRDNTGKDWNVTYAVNKYGFVPEDFQFGLGPFAIQPILNPQMVERGEAGFPSDNNETRVIGTELNGDVRAYPLSVLNNHEVADEKFDSTYVAVAY
jgi:hypothetical protein